MDSIAIAGLSSGIVAIIVAIFTHLKHSECMGFKLDTYNPNELTQSTQQPQQIIVNMPPTPHNTPEIKKHSNETNL